MARLLLVEDDARLVDGLVYFLEKEGFVLAVAQSVAAARQMLSEKAFDGLILDVTLPDGTGFELCEWVRGRGLAVPILFLTAMDEEADVIRGLDSGGDDYLTKPFKLGELCARIRALLRRGGRPMAGAGAAAMLQCGEVTVDVLASRATLRGEPLALTAVEYRLLCFFLRHVGQTLSRTQILGALWDDGGHFVDDNTLSVYIRRLREKIEADPSQPTQLVTVRGLGYQWRDNNHG